MARLSPLLSLHEQGEGLLAPYGVPPPLIALVEAFDPVQIEYAAIRTHAAVFDQPHRATLVVTGDERLSFLNRMLTQELDPKKGFEPFTARRSFWLNRKGRIDADLRVIHLPDRIILDTDAFAADRTKAGLDSYIISEDCAVADATEQYHRIALHGPAAAALLARLSEHRAGAPIAGIQPGHVSVISIANAEVIVDRFDLAGEIGLELLIPVAAAQAVYEALSTPWSSRPAGGFAPQTDLARRIGWHALNIARVESGSALYYADFGPNSLPHETGNETLNDRVSFKKGCYLGQEVVARMQSLGHPKQRLVAFKVAAATPDAPQAVTGTPVLASEAADAPVIGAVTSSCISPMLGNAPIAFAMVKWANSEPETKLSLDLGNARVDATVQSSLRFWPSSPRPG